MGEVVPIRPRTHFKEDYFAECHRAGDSVEKLVDLLTADYNRVMSKEASPADVARMLHVNALLAHLIKHMQK